jgi:hypothetical protein
MITANSRLVQEMKRWYRIGIHQSSAPSIIDAISIMITADSRLVQEMKRYRIGIHQSSAPSIIDASQGALCCLHAVAYD